MAEDSEVVDASPVPSDNKRKIDEVDDEAESEISSQENGEKIENPVFNLGKEDSVHEDEKEVKDADSVEPEAKRPRLDEPDNDATGMDDDVPKPDDAPVDDIPRSDDAPASESNVAAENGEQPTEGVSPEKEPAVEVTSEKEPTVEVTPEKESTVEVTLEKEPSVEVPEETVTLEMDQQSKPDEVISRKIEVPNNKVGVLIGKAGDTIKYLQYNSGAKIQITRDANADPSSTMRPVELVGTPGNIDKAERLIKDVMAEADAGGSPALIARGFAAAQTGGEELLIPIPNDKVGLIIGKGGDTIKSLQTRSGARIQLVPENSEGEEPKERTIRVTGNKQQAEVAREMIKAAMNQAPGKHSAPLGVNQHTYRSSGPPGAQWGSHAPSQTSYDHPQRGSYPSQNQYPQNYGGYPHHPSRSNFNMGWDRTPAAPTQAPPRGGGGYGYYAQGGHTAEPPSAPQANHNYGQPQGGGPGHGQLPPYSQPPQQGYAPPCSDPSYGKPNQAQPFYGGQANPQSGYHQQPGFQSGYPQDAYNKSAYDNMLPQGPAQQSYGPARAAQPGEMQQQWSASGGYGTPQQPYGSGVPPQQSYPYSSGTAAGDGYSNQPGGSAAAPAYGNAGGYGQYPSQRGYGDQQALNNAGYGYQGPMDAGYNTQGSAAYSCPPNSQQAYGPPTATTVPYDQQAAAPSVYAGYGANAPAGYGKTVSPQPAYGQYDSQTYGRH